MAVLNEPQELSVTFEVTRADLEASVGKQLPRAAKGTLRQTFLMLLLVAVLVGFLVFNSAPAGVVRWIVVGGYAIFACWLLLWLLRLNRNPAPRVVDQLIANSGEEAVLGLERITISPDGVRSDHGYCTLMHSWPGVTSIEESVEDVSIRTGTISAYRVPRRAFDSESAMRDFAEQARRWRDACRS